MKKIALALITCVCIVTLMQCNSNTTTSKTDTTSDSTTTKTSDSADVTGNWKIGVQMWTFRMFTFAEALDKVDSAGVKYIEAFWGQPLGGGMKDSFGFRMSADS